MPRDRIRPDSHTTLAEPNAGGARRVVTVAGMAALMMLIGGVAGAHIALTTAKATPPVAQVALASVRIPALGREPQITAPAPREALGATPREVEEAAFARLYEEPLEAAPAHADRTPSAADVRRVALPAPGDVPALVPTRRPPLWLRNAVQVQVQAGQPMIAIVLDDLGLNRPAARRAIRLPAPLTLSFMTYAEELPRFAAEARAAGHELLLHVPMEPSDPAYDAGPKVLRTDLSEEEIVRRLEWGLERFEGFVGINNHMGSKFTAASKGIAQVMRELRARGLLFLDSVTSPTSVAARSAARSGVPFTRRDVFLDHEWRDPAAIRRQLDRLEKIARRQGYAVGIGHPHGATLEVLAAWLPEARRRGYALVPISAIVGRQIEIAQGKAGAAG